MTAVGEIGGAPLFVETSRATPLVHFSFITRSGAVTDPVGKEGFACHQAELAQRGAGSRDRSSIDQALDQVGASLDMHIGRDTISLSGLCLSRNLDEVIAIAADMLEKPLFARDEHEKLMRETRQDLDELRSDDASLVSRYFTRYCVPGHPYARTMIGTTDSLSRIELSEVREQYHRRFATDNMVVGFAGDIDEIVARKMTQRVLSGLPKSGEPLPERPSWSERPTGRRLYLIDKPDRVQSQILIGHLAPRYGTSALTALLPVETAFGGTFTSRMMQEIRVKRGWSYGAGCRIGRAHGTHWLRLYLAPSAEQTPDAVELCIKLYEDLRRDGITEEERSFAIDYLTGSMPFSRATAGQRLGIELRHFVFGLPTDFADTLPDRMATLQPEDIQQAIEDWLFPDDVCIVIVCSAESMQNELASRGLGDIEVVPYDSY